MKVVLRGSRFQAQLRLLMMNDECFYGCKSLEEVIFTDDSKLRHIGKYAFYRSGLKKIRIPSTVETLDDYCFYGWKSLEEVIFPDDSKLRCIGRNRPTFAHVGVLPGTKPAPVHRRSLVIQATEKVPVVSHRE